MLPLGAEFARLVGEGLGAVELRVRQLFRRGLGLAASLGVGGFLLSELGV